MLQWKHRRFGQEYILYIVFTEEATESSTRFNFTVTRRSEIEMNPAVLLRRLPIDILGTR